MTPRASRGTGAPGKAAQANEKGSPGVLTAPGVPTDLNEPDSTLRGSQTLILENFPDPAVARALSPNGRAHWARKKQAREAVEWVVGAAIFDQRLHDMTGPVRITYRWIVPDRRRRDLDNHSTGVVKCLQDCFVRLDLLPADDTSCIVGISTEIVYEQGRRALVIVLAPTDAAPAAGGSDGEGGR